MKTEKLETKHLEGNYWRVDDDGYHIANLKMEQFHKSLPEWCERKHYLKQKVEISFRDIFPEGYTVIVEVKGRAKTAAKHVTKLLENDLFYISVTQDIEILAKEKGASDYQLLEAGWPSDSYGVDESYEGKAKRLAQLIKQL